MDGEVRDGFGVRVEDEGGEYKARQTEKIEVGWLQANGRAALVY